MTSVLVVEDNLTLLEDIALELEMRGYDVTRAVDGRGALNILYTATQLPDIIVSDIAMPDMDGFKLLEHLRAEPKWTGIPFLFLTAFNSPNSIRISKELGADDYIVKPFHADDLVLAMESKLTRVRAFQSQAERSLDQSRRTLLIMISHELRTPLTAIYGGSEMLAESLTQIPDEMVHRMVDLVRKGASRLNRFSAKTVALLEIDSGSASQAFARMRQSQNMTDIVRSAVNAATGDYDASERQVTAALTVPAKPVYVEGLSEYLIMMVEEPLRNALAFSPEGANVEVGLAADDSTVTVTILDHGPGISETDLPHVWERFVQIDRDHFEQQGAGLGLSLMQEFTHLHGGNCTISSELGRGTLVTMSLPRVHITENGN